MYRIASSTTQTRAPQLTQTSRNTNPRVSISTREAHKTNVSRPQPRSNQMKDKVNGQPLVITSNVNAVCATCGKCVFNANHDACVSKFLKDVDARTKKPNRVPIKTNFINSNLSPRLKHHQFKRGYGNKDFLIQLRLHQLAFKKDVVIGLPRLKEAVANRHIRTRSPTTKASDMKNPDQLNAPELQMLFPSQNTTVPSQQEFGSSFGSFVR
ncbi:hypothetical protein Tco_0771098 [Tanacetum coccineum]|uniref:Uncharacterized protein n=1 Tax=Tanacetum coccineum TaxID=301880 RepID=A0ABQ4ZGY3_9ASTR